MADLNKKALIEIIAEEKGYTKKEAGEIVELVIDTMVGTLQKGDTVDLPGFGKFTVKARDARTGINPLTKEKIEIPATKVPAFKASKALKDAVKYIKRISDDPFLVPI